MDLALSYVIGCHFCGDFGHIPYCQATDLDSAKEAFVTEGWATETIKEETGNICPHCRAVHENSKSSNERTH